MPPRNPEAPTSTHALAPGSKAIDAGSDDCEITDQRGVPRPQGAGCDIGAFEALACNFDGIVDAGEQCDDGNHDDGDGCSSMCHTELLTGKSLSLKANPARASRSKVSAKSKDARISLGWGNGSQDDPCLYGGFARIASPAGDGFDTTFWLPPENWKYIGKPGQNRGYKYKDRDGAIMKVYVKPGKQITLKGKGAALGLSLGSDPDPVHVFVTIGERVHCASFGGVVRFRPDRMYKGKNAPAPNTMPDF